MMYDVNIYRSGKTEMSVVAYPLIDEEDGSQHADLENGLVLRLDANNGEHEEAIQWCLGLDEETDTFQAWLEFEAERFFTPDSYLDFDVWDTDRVFVDAPEPVKSWSEQIMQNQLDN